jgi:multisubunit Na+/H+ antiporter MnhE subunit
MIKLFCGILVVAMMAYGIVSANEPVRIEVRKRNAIGRLGLVNVQVAVKAQADGTAIVSFQAPEPGTYILNYTSGPAKGKVAATVRVEKAGPVTSKIKG